MKRTITSKTHFIHRPSIRSSSIQARIRSKNIFFHTRTRSCAIRSGASPRKPYRETEEGSSEKVRTLDYSFSLTNGLSQPPGRSLRTQTLLPEGKRET